MAIVGSVVTMLFLLIWKEHFFSKQSKPVSIVSKASSESIASEEDPVKASVRKH